MAFVMLFIVYLSQSTITRLQVTVYQSVYLSRSTITHLQVTIYQSVYLSHCRHRYIITVSFI
jgi:hypothetical protein